MADYRVAGVRRGGVGVSGEHYVAPEFESESDPAGDHFDYSARTHAAEPSGHPSSIWHTTQILGGVVSIVLMVGVGVWGYKLVMRDVSGVPVVRALEGPMRVQPQDPGGLPADNQGLAVNDVAAFGTAAEPADRLALAPRPVSLTDEDVPIIRKLRQDPAATGVAVKPGTDSDRQIVDELVDRLTAGVEPMAPMADPETAGAAQEVARIVLPEPLVLDGTDETEAAADNGATIELAAVINAPGVTRSLRPVARPTNAVLRTPETSLGSAIDAALQSATQLDVDPDSLAIGTKLAQLGAFDTPELAREAWDRIYAQFEDYMEDKGRVIQEASSGGRTFYRLRAAGFEDLSDARRFCSALVAENTDCIPVTTR
jgi:hypothetical protein